MKKVFNHTAWVLFAYILLLVYHLIGVPYQLQFCIDQTVAGEPEAMLDFLTRPVGAGFLVSVLIGAVFVWLINMEFMHLSNVSTVQAAFRGSWKTLLKKLSLVLLGTMLLFFVFDVCQAQLQMAVSDFIMRATGMDRMDHLALLAGNDSIPVATMRISCGFAEMIVPNIIYFAELYLAYLIYQMMRLLFDSRARSNVAELVV